MAATKYLVKTLAGTTLIDDRSTVPVFMRGKKYLPKNPRELCVGDLVLFDREYISTTLDEVESSLTKSPRYRIAKEALHEKNSDGEYVPRLRTMLCRGSARAELIPRRQLEQRVLLEDMDFPDRDYDAMADHVFSLVNPDYNGDVEDRQRARSTVMQWLQGSTVTIRRGDWHLYRRLEDLHKGFERFTEGSPLDRQARLYNSVRRVIMGYLARRGDGRDSRSGSTIDSDLELGPEIALVLNDFYQEVTHDLSHSRVLAIAKMTGAEARAMEKSHPRLKRGIYTGSLRTRGFSSVTFKDEFLHERALSNVGKSLFKTYCDDHYGQFSSELHQDTDYFDNFIRWYNEPDGWDDSVVVQVLRLMKQGQEVALNNLFLLFSEDLHSGEVERYFKVPGPTIQTLVTRVARYRRGRPHIFAEFDNLSERFVALLPSAIKGEDVTEHNEVSRRLKELSRIIPKNYGIEVVNGLALRMAVCDVSAHEAAENALREEHLEELVSFAQESGDYFIARNEKMTTRNIN